MSEVVDTDSQALHHLLTEAGVDWDGLSGEVARQADALLGDEQAALILDESAFAKKGTASAGVARMWNGRLGKVDNSQVGVFSALCRDQRVTLLDTRLYLPKDWVEDAERCRRAHIPEEARQLRSKYEVSAHESTPVFRAQPAPDFLLPYHHAGERHGTKRCH